jgi:TAT (twin-arginine translocation) pathway signal sequence
MTGLKSRVSRRGVLKAAAGVAAAGTFPMPAIA